MGTVYCQHAYAYILFRPSIMSEQTFAERVKTSRKALGLTQEDAASAMGISRPALAQWETGSTKSVSSANLHNAARVLQKDPEWLATGKMGMLNDESAVPVLSWSALVADLKRKHHDYHISAVNPPPNSYALRIEDDSMQSTSGISFPINYWLIVERANTAEDGSYVIVKQGKVVKFRLLTDEATTLTALNGKYPEERFTGKILGIARQCYFPDIYHSL